MNRRISVLTDVDSIYDSRRGLLCLLLTQAEANLSYELRKQKGDSLWDLYIAKNYKERSLDTFEYPDFGINRAKYLELWEKRSISDWMFYYPSKILDKLVTIILEQEQITDRPIDISGIDLTINTFPYEFDEALEKDLVAYCLTALKGFVTVKLTRFNPKGAVGTQYGSYNYVLIYDILTSASSEHLFNTLAAHPIPETAFLVPNILVTQSEYITGTVDEIIVRTGASLSLVTRWIPINHDVYDHGK